MANEKTAIIVGAGKGLGNAIAKEFAKHNFKIVLIARNEAKLQSYKKDFENEGIQTYIKVANALYPDTVTRVFNKNYRKTSCEKSVRIFLLGTLDSETNLLIIAIGIKDFAYKSHLSLHKTSRIALRAKKSSILGFLI